MDREMIHTVNRINQMEKDIWEEKKAIIKKLNLHAWEDVTSMALKATLEAIHVNA